MSQKLLPQTRVVRFDDLPRAVRERLWSIFTSPNDPRVIACTRSANTVRDSIRDFVAASDLSLKLAERGETKDIRIQRGADFIALES